MLPLSSMHAMQKQHARDLAAMPADAYRGSLGYSAAIVLAAQRADSAQQKGRMLALAMGIVAFAMFPAYVAVLALF